MKVKVDVLGKEYCIYSDEDATKELTEYEHDEMIRVNGLCSPYEKAIFLKNKNTNMSEDGNMAKYKETLIHELIHAYAAESGVSYDDDENLVQWMSVMLPRIMNTYNLVLSKEGEEND